MKVWVTKSVMHSNHLFENGGWYMALYMIDCMIMIFAKMIFKQNVWSWKC